MKPSDILATLQEWAKATQDQICSSPAFAMPCRLGNVPCTLRLDAPRPAETLDILVRFENEIHQIGLCDTPRFPDLHTLWPSRNEVPEPILLALIEKECGPPFQTLENAVRRQLRVEGIARTPDSRPTLAARLVGEDGSEWLTFTATRSSMILESLGSLRFINPAHPVIRERRLPVTVEYAAFTIPAAELTTLAPGDALLLPELESESEEWPVKVIVDGHFAATAATGVTPWNNADTAPIRIVREEPGTVSFGALADLAADTAEWAESDEFVLFGKPQPNVALTLLRANQVIATGRLDRLGSQNAMIIDSLASGGNP